MGAIQLRVVMALLLVAELGHVRSSPLIKPGGSALARSERDVLVGNPNEEEYDYERSYIDDPNYYPDYNDESPEDHHIDEEDDEYDDDSALARSKRDVFAGLPYEEEYDYERSYIDDPNYYPDYNDESPEDHHIDEDDDDDDHEDNDGDDHEDNDGDDHEDNDGDDHEDNDGDDHEDNDDDDHEDNEDDDRRLERRQIKTGHIQQQNGHVKYDVDGAAYDQLQPVIDQWGDSDISLGVEPLPPVQAPDVSKGVEAIDGESSEDDNSNWFYNKFANVGHAIGDTFGTIRDKFSGVAGNAADRIHDAAHSTGSTIVNAYHSLKNRFSELREKIHHLFSSFGLMVQRGADYCIQHLQHTANQVREAQLLDKLQQKLKDGNEQVAAFFTILGEKITSWAQTQGHDDIDEGLILVETHGDHTAEEGNGDQQNMFPNLFQDQEVLDQMNQMVNQGVITQEELDLLYHQTKQGQQDSAIRVHRRRNLRSRITMV